MPEPGHRPTPTAQEAPNVTSPSPLDARHARRRFHLACTGLAVAALACLLAAVTYPTHP
jgi:hypothetical protein